MTATSQTNTISPGSARTGTISNAAFHVYEFSALAGQKVSAYMAVTANTTAFEPSISLVGPNSAILATVAGTNGALIPWMQATNAGKFRVICRDADGVGAGSYSVTVAIIQSNCPPPLTIRCGYNELFEDVQIQSSNYRFAQASGSDVDIYEFNAGMGDRVLVFLTSEYINFNLDAVVSLHGPNGNELATATGPQSQSATLRYNSVDSAGTYYLACRAGGAVGAYGLIFGLNPAIAGETNALIPGIARCGFLESGRADNYAFTANAGDAISISMGAYLPSILSSPAISRRIFPSVTLYGPDNSVVLTRSGSNAVWIPTLILTNSGTYRLLCDDTNNNGEGIYSVTVAKYPGPNEAEPGEATTLVPGVERRGTVSGGDVDIYQFDAIEGDSVATKLKFLDISPGAQLSFFMIQPGGDLVQGIVEPAYGGKRIPCLTRTGKHWLGVHLLNGRGEADYSIQWHLWPGPPSSQAPDYLQVVNCGTDAILRWRTNAAGFRLQGTLTLAQDPAATIWSDLAPPYSARDGFHFFTNAIGSSFQAFRLIKP